MVGCKMIPFLGKRPIFQGRAVKLQECIFSVAFSTLNVNLEALAALAMMADRKVSPDNVKSSEI